MLEPFRAAPVNMGLITALLLWLVSAAVYGLRHSAYTRRLVLVTALMLIGLGLLFWAVVQTRLKLFPLPYL
jgi:hypothetical protein